MKSKFTKFPILLGLIIFLLVPVNVVLTSCSQTNIACSRSDIQNNTFDRSSTQDDWTKSSKLKGNYNFLIHSPAIIRALPKTLNLKYVAIYNNRQALPWVLFDFDTDRIYSSLQNLPEGMLYNGEELDTENFEVFPTSSKINLTKLLYDFLDDKCNFMTEVSNFPIEELPEYSALSLQFSDLSIMRYYVTKPQGVIWPFSGICNSQEQNGSGCDKSVYEDFESLRLKLLTLAGK